MPYASIINPNLCLKEGISWRHGLEAFLLWCHRHRLYRRRFICDEWNAQNPDAKWSEFREGHSQNWHFNGRGTAIRYRIFPGLGTGTNSNLSLLAYSLTGWCNDQNDIRLLVRRNRFWNVRFLRITLLIAVHSGVEGIGTVAPCAPSGAWTAPLNPAKLITWFSGMAGMPSGRSKLGMRYAGNPTYPLWLCSIPDNNFQPNWLRAILPTISSPFLTCINFHCSYWSALLWHPVDIPKCDSQSERTAERPIRSSPFLCNAPAD